MMGLALKNAVFTVKDGGGKKVFAEQGEILFTHFGSGPLALSASAHMRPDPAAYSAEIDMKCALTGRRSTGGYSDLRKPRKGADNFGTPSSSIIARS
ncbi:MAG: hypothetical protein ACLUFM_01715 [Lachnospiraceae bacterium]